MSSSFVKADLAKLSSLVGSSPRYTGEFDKTEPQGREEFYVRVNVLLRSRLGEVDFIVVGIGRVGGEGVAFGKRDDDDILRVVRRAEDGIVAVDSRLLDAGDPIDTRLLPIGVNMIDHYLHVRESSVIWNWPARLVENTLPTR